MPDYNLLVRDSDDIVMDWNRGGSLDGDAAGKGYTIHNAVSLGSDPEVGGTYDGATYTPPTPPDYFVVKDGATELADGASVELAGDGASTKILTVQKKNGSDDADKVGGDEVIKVLPMAVIEIDKMQVVLDTSDGAEDFTIGPFAASQKGCVAIVLRDDAGVLPGRRLMLEVI